MARRDVVLCVPVRTAIGTFAGTLKSTPAPQLGATVIRAVLARAAVAGAEIGTVVMGNVIQAGTKMNPARQAAIRCSATASGVVSLPCASVAVRASRWRLNA